VFDTNIVVVGNVLTAPEWRRTATTNSLVANFKVASTARRLERDTGRWVDGNSLRVRVNCWRKLAEGVASSVMVGDPVVVVGRLYTRDWTDADGNSRTMYEMEAVAVGHDLARGRGRFTRNRPTLATSAVETPETDTQVRGEAAEPVSEDEAPTRYGDGLFDDGEPGFVDVPPAGPGGYDPLTTLRGGGFEPFDTASAASDDELTPYGSGPADDLESGATGTGVNIEGAEAAPDVAGGSGVADAPRPAEPSTTGEESADPGATTGRPRSRRNVRRTPILA
jgi:single-strand DNA-binding protein